MKHQTQNEKLAKSQNREFVTNESSGSTKRICSQLNHNSQMEKRALSKALFPPLSEGGLGRSSILGKAPPGPSYRPVSARGHPPENKAGPPRGSPGSSQRDGPDRPPDKAKGRSTYNLIEFRSEKEELINRKDEIQIFTNIKFSKIMKKQILILAFFIVAVLASTSNSFGQLLPGSAPRGLTGCVTDALHPKAGVSYPYTIDNTNGVVPDNYSWWITKNPQFIVPATGLADQSSKLTVTPGQLIATDATGGVDGKTINITWSPEILAATLYQGTPNIAATAAAPSPTFVAVMANGSCTNNIQVFEINPKPSFTVDITNVLPDASAPVAYGIDAPQCVGKVVGATYASSVVSMDYGTNVLYFEVIAANFVTSWKPTFQIMGGLTGTQTADISIYSTLAGAKLGTTPIEAGVTGLATNGTYPEGTALTADASVTNTALGVSVYVRVTIHNNKEESIAALGSGFILAVDGKDLTNQWDLVDATCVDPAAADQNDQATQTITPRPDVTNAIAPAPALNPDTFIPKN